MSTAGHYFFLNIYWYFNADPTLIQILVFMLMCLLIATPVANLLEPDILVTMGQRYVGAPLFSNLRINY